MKKNQSIIFFILFFLFIPFVYGNEPLNKKVKDLIDLKQNHFSYIKKKIITNDS